VEAFVSEGVFGMGSMFAGKVYSCSVT